MDVAQDYGQGHRFNEHLNCGSIRVDLLTTSDMYIETNNKLETQRMVESPA